MGGDIRLEGEWAETGGGYRLPLEVGGGHADQDQAGLAGVDQEGRGMGPTFTALTLPHIGTIIR